MTDLTKIVAEAIAESKARWTAGDHAGEDLIEIHRNMPSTWRYAEVICQAIEDAGFVIVPAEPTEAMLDAAWHQTGESNDMRGRVHTRYSRYYKAMTGAAK